MNLFEAGDVIAVEPGIYSSGLDEASGWTTIQVVRDNRLENRRL